MTQGTHFPLLFARRKIHVMIPLSFFLNGLMLVHMICTHVSKKANGCPYKMYIAGYQVCIHVASTHKRYRGNCDHASTAPPSIHRTRHGIDTLGRERYGNPVSYGSSMYQSAHDAEQLRARYDVLTTCSHLVLLLLLYNLPKIRTRRKTMRWYVYVCVRVQRIPTSYSYVVSGTCLLLYSHEHGQNGASA